MLESLTKNILITIIYYDVLDLPLTVFECWKYLIRDGEENTKDNNQYSLIEIYQELENHKLRGLIEENQGFYFLRGRKSLVAQRSKRNKITEKKYRIIQKIVRWLRLVPYLKMIAVTGRVANKNAEKKSDLDLFIVIQKGRLFTGRLLVTFLTHILGRRRYAKKITDRICLNYYVTDENLEIGLQDLFSSSEYSFLFPIFGWKTFQVFQTKNNWIKRYKINYRLDEIPNLKMITDSLLTSEIRKVLEKILDFDWLENGLKKWQLQRIAKDPRTHYPESAVSADSKALVFLPQPKGPQVFEKYQERLKNYQRIK